MENTLYKLNPWWESEFEFESINRDKYLSLFEKYFSIKDVVIITGLRRIGKTTLMKQFIQSIIKKGINPKHICYLTLDALAFEEFSIQELIKKFREINGLRQNEKIYLFLDEIIYKKHFSQELKNIYDFGNAKVYASSSSASVLKDKKAFLTGRSRLVEVEPLDFMEFLKFKKLTYKKAEKYLINKYFKRYMELGGIPEYVLYEDPTYIINLINEIIYKDIIAVHQLKKIKEISELFKLLCERVGKSLSYSKIARILRISDDTIKEYIRYFEEVYLFFVIEKDGKLNERILSEKKIYCVDVGIKNITVGFEDLGAIYENLVFLNIKENSPRYLKEKFIEIDFIYKDYLIEAKYGSELNEKQKALFEKKRIKNKIIAKGVDFFLV